MSDKKVTNKNTNCKIQGEIAALLTVVRNDITFPLTLTLSLRGERGEKDGFNESNPYRYEKNARRLSYRWGSFGFRPEEISIFCLRYF